MVVSALKTSRNTVYEDLPPLPFSIAYRMVGSASEGEDIVQEAFLRLHPETSQGTDIESPKAWLSRGGLPGSRPRAGYSELSHLGPLSCLYEYAILDGGVNDESVCGRSDGGDRKAAGPTSGC
jgi:hypothetical protein